MYPGQGSNGMQPIMSSNSQPIVSGGEAVILAPSEKKPKRWPIVVIAILVLIAIGTGIAAFLLTRSNEVVGDEVNSYIEYFVYGTEGGENQITNDTFAINSEDYAIAKEMQNASSEKSSEYFNKLVSKYSVLMSAGKEKIDAELLTSNESYLNFYGAIMQSINSDWLIKVYKSGQKLTDIYESLTVDDNLYLSSVYNTLDTYAKNKLGFYARVQSWGCLLDNQVDYNCVWGVEKEDELSWGNESTEKDLLNDKNFIYIILVNNLKSFYERENENA